MSMAIIVASFIQWLLGVQRKLSKRTLKTMNIQEILNAQQPRRSKVGYPCVNPTLSSLSCFKQFTQQNRCTTIGVTPYTPLMDGDTHKYTALQAQFMHLLNCVKIFEYIRPKSGTCWILKMVHTRNRNVPLPELPKWLLTQVICILFHIHLNIWTRVTGSYSDIFEWARIKQKIKYMQKCSFCERFNFGIVKIRCRVVLHCMWCYSGKLHRLRKLFW